jgi:DNA-binding transcriptional ArsR family regulator
MNKIKEDLLLHPVRMRIVLAVAGREVTAQELATELPDVPQATLYRNINTLAAAGILAVVQERRVRNTIEKTYALPDESNLLLTAEDLEEAGPEDYIRLFAEYLGLQLGYYVRYVQQGDVDLARDHVGFHMFPVYVSEAEMQSLGEALNAVLLPCVENKPSPQRRRYILGVLSIPDVAGAPVPPGSQTGMLAVESTEES